LTPLSFGVIDGLYEGVSAPLRTLGAYAADRLRLHKQTAAAGYGISAFCKLGLLAAGGALAPFVAVLLLDRAGKGLRSAPRDAMISFNTPPEALGVAFGVHRALDTMGALTGPILAFTLIQLSSGTFDMIFVVSFCFALIGLSIITLLVTNERVDAPPTSVEAPTWRDALSLLVHPYLRRLLPVAGALSLFTISDGFYYLVLQQRLALDFGFFPLLYVSTSATYLLLAIPMGALADRFGRGKVLTAGYLLLLVAYTALLRPVSGPVEIAIYLVLFGAYYAATDGVLMAMASANLPSGIRATGLALLTSVTGLTRLAGSVLFGLIWTVQSEATAIWMLLAGLIVATLALATLLRRDESYASN
jgi:MFS family permease